MSLRRMLTGRRTRSAVFLPIACLAVACARAPERVRKTAVSWGATAQRVGKAWLAGAIPATYAARTLRTARARLADQREALRSAPPDPRARDLVDRLAALERAVARLESALDGQDHGAADATTREVAALTRQLAAAARSERAA